MTRVSGGLWGPYSTWTLGTIPTAYTNIVGGSVPTTDPGSGALQWSHTLVDADFPVLPADWTCDWVAVVVMCGTNGDASSRNVFVKPYKNGTAGSQNLATTAAGAKFSVQVTVTPVVSGDVIGANCFAASAAAVTWDRVIMQLWPTHIRPRQLPALLAQGSMTVGYGADPGVSGVTLDNGSLFYYYTGGGQSNTSVTITDVWSFEASAGYGWGRLYYAEFTTYAASGAGYTFRPYRGPVSWSGRLFRRRIPT